MIERFFLCIERKRSSHLVGVCMCQCRCANLTDRKIDWRTSTDSHERPSGKHLVPTRAASPRITCQSRIHFGCRISCNILSFYIRRKAEEAKKYRGATTRFTNKRHFFCVVISRPPSHGSISAAFRIEVVIHWCEDDTSPMVI